MSIKKFATGLILFLMLTLITSLTFAKSELIEIKIWCDKLEYLVREPIIVNYSIRNMSDRIINMTFLDLPFHFKIKNQNGISYPTRLSIQVGIGNRDSLKPGEEHKGGANITGIYEVISAGEYTCYFEIPAGKSKIIKIIVKEPEGQEKIVLRMFLGAEKLKYSRDRIHGGRDLKKAEPGFLKYQELVDKYPNSIYSPLSLDCAIGVYQFSRNLEERRKIIPVCKRLIENYPNSIYFASAFSSLVDVYEVLKDKQGAIKIMQELIKKHPDSKISERAEYWLEKIEEWEL